MGVLRHELGHILGFLHEEVRHKFFTGAHLDPAERKAHLGRRSPNGVVAQQAELTDVFIPWVVDPTSVMRERFQRPSPEVDLSPQDRLMAMAMYGRPGSVAPEPDDVPMEVSSEGGLDFSDLC